MPPGGVLTRSWRLVVNGLVDVAATPMAANSAPPVAAVDPYQNSGIAIGEYEAETECAIEVYGSELISFARAVLARWGQGQNSMF